MAILVTLAEAASYLGVSKATLRNWDKEGKLKAQRHPVNHYRVYEFEQLRALKAQTSFLDDTPLTASAHTLVADLRGVRSLVGRLHSILRDNDAGEIARLARALYQPVVSRMDREHLVDPHIEHELAPEMPAHVGHHAVGEFRAVEQCRNPADLLRLISLRAFPERDPARVLAHQPGALPDRVHPLYGTG